MGWGQMGTEPGVGVPGPVVCLRRSCLPVGVEAPNGVHCVLLLGTDLPCGRWLLLTSLVAPGWGPAGLGWSVTSGVPKVPSPAAFPGRVG